MAELPPTITVTLDPAATASIADLADAATGLRAVFERLDARDAEQRLDDRTLDPNEVNERWAELRDSMPPELSNALFDWFQSKPVPTWSLYKLAQHYHWNR